MITCPTLSISPRKLMSESLRHAASFSRAHQTYCSHSTLPAAHVSHAVERRSTALRLISYSVYSDRKCKPPPILAITCRSVQSDTCTGASQPGGTSSSQQSMQTSLSSAPTARPRQQPRAAITSNNLSIFQLRSGKGFLPDFGVSEKRAAKQSIGRCVDLSQLDGSTSACHAGGDCAAGWAYFPAPLEAPHLLRLYSSDPFTFARTARIALSTYFHRRGYAEKIRSKSDT